MSFKRVNVAKVQDAVQALGQSRAAKRHKALRERIVSRLSGATEQTLLAVEAVLEEKVDKPGEQFPRGVSQLGGPPPKSVPYKSILVCLSKATNQTKTILQRMPGAKELLSQLFLWSLNATPTTGLPERKMLLEAFYQWYVTEYERNGCVLQYLTFDRPLDWTFDIGAFALVRPSCGRDCVDEVRHRRSGQLAKLLANGQPLQLLEQNCGDYGKWYIKDNYCDQTAYLKGNGSTFMLYVCFSHLDLDEASSVVFFSPARASPPDGDLALVDALLEGSDDKQATVQVLGPNAPSGAGAETDVSEPEA